MKLSSAASLGEVQSVVFDFDELESQKEPYAFASSEILNNPVTAGSRKKCFSFENCPKI